jgi:hypothetical protein
MKFISIWMATAMAVFASVLCLIVKGELAAADKTP